MEICSCLPALGSGKSKKNLHSFIGCGKQTSLTFNAHLCKSNLTQFRFPFRIKLWFGGLDTLSNLVQTLTRRVVVGNRHRLLQIQHNVLPSSWNKHRVPRTLNKRYCPVNLGARGVPIVQVPLACRGCILLFVPVQAAPGHSIHNWILLVVHPQ